MIECPPPTRPLRGYRLFGLRGLGSGVSANVSATRGTIFA